MRREAALSGDDPDVMYVELSADKNANPDDRAAWRKANPSFPHRTGEGAICVCGSCWGRSSLSSVRAWAFGMSGSRGVRRSGRAVGSVLRSLRSLASLVRVKFTPDGSHVAIAGR